jgi:hypothetical protein
MVYNDGYIPVLGAKHPDALGQPLLECWSEIRDMIGPMFRGVVETGRPVYANDLMFPLGRLGFIEECYFTFSYSPIRDEHERVGGVLVTCTETTARVIGERRLRMLRDLPRAPRRRDGRRGVAGRSGGAATNPYGRRSRRCTAWSRTAARAPVGIPRRGAGLLAGAPKSI